MGGGAAPVKPHTEGDVSVHTTEGGQPFAAVDLGSNSFHLIVARPIAGGLCRLDREREMVRLAAGLDAENNIDEWAWERAMACLARFGQRLRDIPAGRLRIVATNALRKASNARAFIVAAEELLGHAVEIISGREEARLIYLGVSHSQAESSGRHMVVDIGGGSTELILGECFEPQRLESLHMGCVSYSKRFFPDGTISLAAWEAARTAALLELRGIRRMYRSDGANVIGASGTIRSVASVVQAMGWCEDGISHEALAKLEARLLEAGHIKRVVLKGIKDERWPVFMGGVAVLSALFAALKMDTMLVSDSALREGVIYDLLGRVSHEDVRERTIAGLEERFAIDRGHGEVVATVAGQLLAMVAGEWGLGDVADGDLLIWAARLHELGLVVSHSQYHKHGAYLLRHADLPGFSNTEQQWLALLVRGHRRKLPVDELDSYDGKSRERLLRLTLLLRLAVLLLRGRGGAPLPAIGCKATPQGLALHFPPGWCEEHPLSCADLSREAGWWEAVGYQLRYA